MRNHTREKTFKCSLCLYSARDSHDLKMHIRTHTGEKPYKCDLCSYASTHSSNLKQHMRTHTGKSKPPALNVESTTGAVFQQQQQSSGTFAKVWLNSRICIASYDHNVV
ncbi:zinc-finger double domain-containing protein [Ditylenchus destructor]|uniref:Zinc-finger double domain-containing protein n=1 Tax=Ditylenchus destructor TaxID=166010 RepID=A0AAD4MEY3_9BILA|nr:zinc-finger double domain-containing protein [Ditylenchus destructor]